MYYCIHHKYYVWKKNEFEKNNYILIPTFFSPATSFHSMKRRTATVHLILTLVQALISPCSTCRQETLWCVCSPCSSPVLWRIVWRYMFNNWLVAVNLGKTFLAMLCVQTQKIAVCAMPRQSFFRLIF